MKPLIKICGIADLNFLKEVVQINEISYLGFIFYEKSPRYITKDFLNDIKKFDFKDKRPVCVFVNASSEYIMESISYFKNPLLQFHGNETNQFCSSFKKDFWKVIHVKSIESIDRIEEYPDADNLHAFSDTTNKSSKDNFSFFKRSNAIIEVIIFVIEAG